MEPITTNWKTGDIVTLQCAEKTLKTKGNSIYKEFVASRYVCVREASKGERGILVKVLGKAPDSSLEIIEDRPFAKDGVEQLLDDIIYYSYPFAKAMEIEEVLSIICHNPCKRAGETCCYISVSRNQYKSCEAPGKHFKDTGCNSQY